jgi:type II secretory pathway component GspD/PulD (secretin)
MRIHHLLIFTLLFGVSAGIRAQTPDVSTPVLAISPNGADPAGNKLYSIIANGSNITDVLKKLFETMGIKEYTIHQDVSGTIDIRMLKATGQQLMREIAEAARPPLRISRDEKGFYRVSQELVTSPTGISLGPGGVVPPGVVPFKGAGLPPIGYSQLAFGNRPVTLNVPDDRRISLADAVRQISQQTGVQVTLDRRVSREVEFSGTITRAPLSLVLQSIADTAGLKLIADANGATLTPPDQFLIRVRDILLGNYTSMACPGCGERLNGAWKYCPNCSRITPIGDRDLRGRGAIPKRQPSKAGKIGSF